MKRLFIRVMKSIWDTLQIGTDWITYKFIVGYDNYERSDAYKQKNPESYAFGRFKIKYYDKFMGNTDRRRSTLKEQKAFIESLLLGFRFSRPDIDTIDFSRKSRMYRPVTRERMEALWIDMKDKSVSLALKDKQLLEEEFIAMIKVAEETTKFDDMYLFIIEDLVDKIARRKAFLQMMILPISTVVTLVGTEIYVALSIIPLMTAQTGIEDFSKAPTIQSYVKLREMLFNPPWELLWQVPIGIGILIIIFNLNSTKWLLDQLLLMFPFMKNLIIRWEISKLFNSLRTMSKTKRTHFESAEISIRVVKNKVIRHSLMRDIDYNMQNTKSPDYYSMFQHSVYVYPFILEQLRYAKEMNADTNLILESVYRENKDAMENILKAPAQIIAPIIYVIIGAYLVARLLPLYPELNVLIEEFF